MTHEKRSSRNPPTLDSERRDIPFANLVERESESSINPALEKMSSTVIGSKSFFSSLAYMKRAAIAPKLTKRPATDKELAAPSNCW